MPWSWIARLANSLITSQGARRHSRTRHIKPIILRIHSHRNDIASHQPEPLPTCPNALSDNTPKPSNATHPSSEMNTPKAHQEKRDTAGGSGRTSEVHTHPALQEEPLGRCPRTADRATADSRVGGRICLAVVRDFELQIVLAFGSGDVSPSVCNTRWVGRLALSRPCGPGSGVQVSFTLSGTCTASTWNDRIRELTRTQASDQQMLAQRTPISGLPQGAFGFSWSEPCGCVPGCVVGCVGNRPRCVAGCVGNLPR